MSSRPFERRAELYERLDARLRCKTRFFGAACLTNRVLHRLASPSAPPWCSARTCSWLADTGAMLEAANLAIAGALAEGALAGPSLDARIVSAEQSLVERQLQCAKGAPLYARMLAELDAQLNFGCLAACVHFRSDLRWYSRVLSVVRTELAAPIEFAIQAHREAIGLALIATLRRGDSLPA